MSLPNDINDTLDAWSFGKWHLLPPKRERSAERFENRPARQRALFIGANDLPGQTYLVDPFERPEVANPAAQTQEIER